MQTTELGHGRGWLDAPAAASIVRIDSELGHPIQITEAGRTGERQQELRDLYEAGKGNYAAPRGESPHEAGNAFDTNERPVVLLARHGWWRPLSFEPWHFVYRAANDQHRNDPAPATATPATPIANPTEIGEEMFIADMPNGSFLVVPQGNGKPRAVVLDGGSGAATSGIPRLKFESEGSRKMLAAAVIF